MNIVRPLELKLTDGTLIMDSEKESVADLKSAIFYMNEKTKDKSDEDFVSFLRNVMKNGYFPNDEDREIESDMVAKDKYPFLGVFDSQKFKFLYTDVLDFLITQNNLS